LRPGFYAPTERAMHLGALGDSSQPYNRSI
jgi:hypothetical protein